LWQLRRRRQYRSHPQCGGTKDTNVAIPQ
jgi:hypothetical protein